MVYGKNPCVGIGFLAYIYAYGNFEWGGRMEGE